MKKLGLVIALLLVSSMVSATIGTYTGETEGEGPENRFLIGIASDKPLTIELDVADQEGLNITYNDSIKFHPENSSRSIQYSGNQLPLKELYITILTDEPEKTVYEIPVTLRAFSNEQGEQGQASPQIVHERDYQFYYRTELSSDYGLEGDLIRPEPGSEPEEDNVDERLNISEENPITGENQTSSQGEGQESESVSRTTYLLILGILAVFGYTLKEALL